MLLFYIRHGDPIYHPDDLTGLGMRQAEALARRLSLYGLDSIYSSTSKRARLTANPTAQILKREIVELDWCKEDYAYQDFSAPNEFGKIKWLFEIASLRSVMVSDEVTALGHRWWEHPQLADPRYRNGYYRIRTETHAFLADQGYIFDASSSTYQATRENQQRIALFAHQGFGMAFMSSVLNIPYPMYCTRFDMCHSGMTVISFSEKIGKTVPTVLTLSNDAHLYRDGLPTNYQNKIRF